MCIHIIFIFIYIHIHIYKTLKRALVVQAFISPPPPRKEKKKQQQNKKNYTFKIQNELAMAYSPSVQYGYYKRLESSLFVFFFLFLFFKGFFFFATLENFFKFFFFFSLQNSFHTDFNPVEFVARMNNLVNRFYFIFFCSSAVNGSRVRRVHLKVYFGWVLSCFGQNRSISSLLFPLLIQWVESPSRSGHSCKRVFQQHCMNRPIDTIARGESTPRCNRGRGAVEAFVQKST